MNHFCSQYIYTWAFWNDVALRLFNISRNDEVISIVPISSDSVYYTQIHSDLPWSGMCVGVCLLTLRNDFWKFLGSNSRNGESRRVESLRVQSRKWCNAGRIFQMISLSHNWSLLFIAVDEQNGLTITASRGVPADLPIQLDCRNPQGGVRSSSLQRISGKTSKEALIEKRRLNRVLNRRWVP